MVDDNLAILFQAIGIRRSLILHSLKVKWNKWVMRAGNKKLNTLDFAEKKSNRNNFLHIQWTQKSQKQNVQFRSELQGFLFCTQTKFTKVITLSIFLTFKNFWNLSCNISETALHNKKLFLQQTLHLPFRSLTFGFNTFSENALLVNWHRKMITRWKLFSFYFVKLLFWLNYNCFWLFFFQGCIFRKTVNYKVKEQCQGYKSDWVTFFILSVGFEILHNEVQKNPKLLKLPCTIPFKSSIRIRNKKYLCIFIKFWYTFAPVIFL